MITHKVKSSSHSNNLLFCAENIIEGKTYNVWIIARCFNDALDLGCIMGYERTGLIAQSLWTPINQIKIFRINDN